MTTKKVTVLRILEDKFKDFLKPFTFHTIAAFHLEGRFSLSLVVIS